VPGVCEGKIDEGRILDLKFDARQVGKYVLFVDRGTGQDDLKGLNSLCTWESYGVKILPWDRLFCLKVFLGDGKLPCHIQKYLGSDLEGRAP